VEGCEPHLLWLFQRLLVVTQAWRILSEFLRADFRGEGRISVYQIMSLLSIGYAFLILAVFPSGEAATPDLAAGMLTLWDPAVLLFFELLWIAAFIYTGRSRVTGATIRLHVVREKIEPFPNLPTTRAPKPLAAGQARKINSLFRRRIENSPELAAEIINFTILRKNHSSCARITQNPVPRGGFTSSQNEGMRQS